jgi:uncharacterized membrane protein YheB (UPF0754 family)
VKEEDAKNPKRTGPDWERIEISYRAGVLSLREIAAQDGNVTEGAIRKRAKRDNWERDLAAKIKAKADALVRKEEVRKASTRANQIQLDKPTEASIVDANAMAITRVRLEHREDIARSRRLATALLEELEQQTAQVPELAALGAAMANPDERGIDKLNELYQKIISLPARTKTMKDLAETLKTLIALEREAYSISDAPDKPKDFENLSDEELDERIEYHLAGRKPG